MKTLRVGIASYEEMKARTVAMARGERRMTPDEPTVWFTSTESFAKVLSAGNRELVRTIVEKAPRSLDELAQMTGRAKSNLSRTLKTMSGYGLIRLERGVRGRITPKLAHDRVELDLPLASPRHGSALEAKGASGTGGSRKPRRIASPQAARARQAGEPANSGMPVYVGIDVGCAQGKPLPICFATFRGHRLEPLELPQAVSAEFPRGRGNGEVAADRPFVSTATRLVAAVRRAAEAQGWTIARVAVDAPAAPPPEGNTRICETALNECGLSLIRTPDRLHWKSIRSRCRDYLVGGGALDRLPYANAIWMLYGFELFGALRKHFDVIEVYPYAIVRELTQTVSHKKTKEGYRHQLDIVAGATGWSDPVELDHALKTRVPGKDHDRLDAFMAAWLASLEPRDRRAYGNADDGDDAIWVPCRDGAGPGLG